MCETGFTFYFNYCNFSTGWLLHSDHRLYSEFNDYNMKGTLTVKQLSYKHPTGKNFKKVYFIISLVFSYLRRTSIFFGMYKEKSYFQDSALKVKKVSNSKCERTYFDSLITFLCQARQANYLQIRNTSRDSRSNPSLGSILVFIYPW